ncbi:type II secretion system protein [Candidatus Saccharibacteria bacterium]|nr:type II secretion system protein [Candidatus Saccharibacteria bacterium]
MKRHGFTIIELIIVITVMAILLTLSTAGMNGYQANGRDTERKADVETIALHLETYYTSGKDGDTAPPGQYPPTDMITNNTVRTYLRDIDDSNLAAPGKDAASTFINASNSGAQSPTKDQYIYQPLTTSGSLCAGSSVCTKFTLYYKTEIDNTTHKIASKNQ